MAASALRQLSWTACIATVLAAAAGPARADILVGVAAPLTGAYEWGGEEAQHGIELAAEELNAAGGLLGQAVALSLADDYCDPEQAVAAARKLVADKVTAVIGHQCSGAAIPASKVYEAAHVPFVTGSATNPLLTDRGLRFTFRATFRDDTQGAFAAEYMVRQLGARRIAVVHDTRTYGQGLADAVRQRLAALGAPEVLLTTVEPGQAEFGDLIDGLRQAAVDALYYGGYPREAGLLRRQMIAAGLAPAFMAGGAIGREEYALLAGPAAEGTIMTQGVGFHDRPERAAFAARFRAKYGAEALADAFGGAQGFDLWTQAVVLAGTTDGEAVADALRRGRFQHDGLPVWFDAKGDVQGPAAEIGLWVWHDGKPVAIAPPATAP